MVLSFGTIFDVNKNEIKLVCIQPVHDTLFMIDDNWRFYFVNACEMCDACELTFIFLVFGHWIKISQNTNCSYTFYSAIVNVDGWSLKD